MMRNFPIQFIEKVRNSDAEDLKKMKKRKRERQRNYACVCVCVYVCWGYSNE